MKITVLGAAGQIGAYLTEYLEKKGHTVHAIDKIFDPQWHDLTLHNNAYLRERIINSDFVFFLAFAVGGSRYLKKYQHTYEFISENTKMMAIVFQMLQDHKKKFVFASSQMSNMNHSPYGVCKRMGELYTKTLDGRIVKFWNVYGVEKDPEKSHVITDLIRKGFEETKVTMLTDGTEERQFLYAEDCCEALETVMECYDDFSVDDPLHITSFRSDTIKTVAATIVGQFHIHGMYDVDIQPGEGKDTVQMDKKNQADTHILKWWVPKTGIHVGIKKVFDEMKKEYVND